MIYTHISSIMCVFACFEHFCKFWLCKPNRVSRRRFWGLVDQWGWQKRPKNIQHGRIMPNTTGENSATRSHKAKQETNLDSHNHRLPRGGCHELWWPLQAAHGSFLHLGSHFSLRCFDSRHFVRHAFVVLQFQGLFFSHGGDCYTLSTPPSSSPSRLVFKLD